MANKRTTKETTKDNASTVAAKAAQKIAREILKENTKMNEVHVTSDGTAFFTRNDAQNHANSLKNRDVFSCKRAALFGESNNEASDNENPTGSEGKNSTEPNVNDITGEETNKTKE